MCLVSLRYIHVTGYPCFLSTRPGGYSPRPAKKPHSRSRKCRQNTPLPGNLMQSLYLSGSFQTNALGTEGWGGIRFSSKAGSTVHGGAPPPTRCHRGRLEDQQGSELRTGPDGYSVTCLPRATLNGDHQKKRVQCEQPDQWRVNQGANQDGQNLLVGGSQIQPCRNRRAPPVAVTHREIDPEPGAVASKQIGMPASETEGLLHHAPQRHPVMVCDLGFREISHHHPALVQTGTEIVVFTVNDHALVETTHLAGQRSPHREVGGGKPSRSGSPFAMPGRRFRQSQCEERE